MLAPSARLLDDDVTGLVVVAAGLDVLVMADVAVVAVLPVADVALVAAGVDDVLPVAGVVVVAAGVDDVVPVAAVVVDGAQSCDLLGDASSLDSCENKLVSAVADGPRDAWLITDTLSIGPTATHRARHCLPRPRALYGVGATNSRRRRLY